MEPFWLCRPLTGSNQEIDQKRITSEYAVIQPQCAKNPFGKQVVFSLSALAINRSRRKKNHEPHGESLLLQQLGIETLVNLPLVGWVMIGLECGDQSAQSRRKDDQISGTVSRSIGVGYTGRDEYCRSRSDGLGSIGISERQFAIQDVPGFVIGTVDVKCGWPAAAPLMDSK